VQAMTGMEAFKQVEYTLAALNECAPDIDPIHRLQAREALLDAYRKDRLLNGPGKLNLDLDIHKEGTHDHTPLDFIVDRCATMEEQQQAICFDEQANLVVQNGYQAILQSLTLQAGFDAPQLQAFDAAYERAKKYHTVTERLGGHHFEICVELPGSIVAHNADRTVAHNAVQTDEQNGEACWEIDGDSIRDREVTLQLVTRLERGSKSE